MHYNGANNHLFVNGKEIHKFKVKDSEIVATPLCWGNISKDWTIDTMKKTGLNGYVYDFSVDYDAIAVDDILDIHNYLQIVNVNGDNPVFFPFSIKTSKCIGSCNNINNPHPKLCVPDDVKKWNVKVFNLCQELMNQDT